MTKADQRRVACLQRLIAKGDQSGPWQAMLDKLTTSETQRCATDPRDPRPNHEMVGRHAIFRDHNCSRCRSGERACVRGDPGRCEWPHARND